MTTEEAIEELTFLIGLLIGANKTEYSATKALQMAISALKKESEEEE